MKNFSRPKKWYWFGLIFLLILSFVLIITHLPLSVYNKGESQGLENTTEPVEKLIDLSQVSGINNIYAVAANINPPSSLGGGAGGINVVRTVIFPHHTLIANELSTYWQELAKSSVEPSVVVIIGAAHNNQGDSLVQTTSQDYSTDFGTVETDNDIVAALISGGIVDGGTDSFDNEHSVGVHLPFVAKLFPGVSVVPIIAKSNAGEKEAQALVNLLKENLPTDALVVFSLDFSHGLSSDQALTNDDEIRSLMSTNDLEKISLLNETFIDSPFTLQTYLLWLKENSWSNELVWQGTSGQLTGAVNEPGTSYMVFFAPSRETLLTISLVGDVMLSRAVGSKLKTVSIEDAFLNAKNVFVGSDLAFANLESVLSTSTVESTKEIRFKADPARIDVLKYLGFTQVSVTNNHIGDYGRAAWDESWNYLNAGEVIPIGGYGNDGAPVFAETAGRRIAFLAFDTTIWKMDAATLMEIISPLKNQTDIIFVSFHWGNEYQHQPTSQQVELAHAAIDAGADVIIGHHPHVLEGIEKYNNGLILYSLGNFIFDQFGDDENESLVAQLVWEGNERKLFLIPMKIVNYFPTPTANVEEYSAVLERLASWSDESLVEEIKSGSIVW